MHSTKTGPIAFLSYATARHLLPLLAPRLRPLEGPHWPDSHDIHDSKAHRGANMSPVSRANFFTVTACIRPRHCLGSTPVRTAVEARCSRVWIGVGLQLARIARCARRPDTELGGAGPSEVVSRSVVRFGIATTEPESSGSVARKAVRSGAGASDNAALCRPLFAHRSSNTTSRCLHRPSEFLRKSGQSQLPRIGWRDSSSDV
jgi:hypothetical protein